MHLLPHLEGLHSAEAFSPVFLHAFLARVGEIERRPRDFQGALEGRIIATVFEEPSTRTRLSFEAAALRLGAGVITVAEPGSSSSAKGESLRDSARIVGGYADLIVWRHPRDGASRLAAQYAGVPVVNAGDGRLGHPTQTLVDLYTLHRSWDGFAGRTVAVMGDLRHGRTARSLAWGLALLGARVLPLPAPGLDWEPEFEESIRERTGYQVRNVRHPRFADWTGSETARLLEPLAPVQAALFGDATLPLEQLDALYLTRLQQERGAQAVDGAYPGLRPEQMRDPLLEKCLFLHPLPRRGEIPVEVDEDPRARYFEQARAGPQVRMAVFLAMLAADSWPLPALTPLPAGHPEPELGACPNPNCITRSEGLVVPWRVQGRGARRFLCAYCDVLLPVDYAGCRSTRRLHPLHSPSVQRIRPENLRPFRARDAASREGYLWVDQ
ncbi:MAG TPA: aspartate carbamoyltransferase [Planctomycetota bacterium]